MERKSIILNSNKNNSLDELVKILDTGINGNLILCSDQKVANSRVMLLVFDKYYMRVSSYVSLSVLLIEEENKQRAELIGSGGGGGIFNIDYGANDIIAEKARDILIENGFKIQN